MLLQHRISLSAAQLFAIVLCSVLHAGHCQRASSTCGFQFWKFSLFFCCCFVLTAVEATPEPHRNASFLCYRPQPIDDWLIYADNPIKQIKQIFIYLFLLKTGNLASAEFPVFRRCCPVSFRRRRETRDVTSDFLAGPSLSLLNKFYFSPLLL